MTSEKAQWNESEQMYHCVTANLKHHWFSDDGDEWFDVATGKLAVGDAFEAASIALVGGPRSGTTVA